MDQNGDVKVDDTAKRAAEIESKLAKSKAAPPGHVHQRRGPGAPGLRVGPLGLPGELPVRLPERRPRSSKDFQKKMGWARYPRTREGQAEPPAARRASTSACRSYSKKPELAFEAAECLAQPENQAIATEKGGLPPTTEARLRRRPRSRRPTRSPTCCASRSRTAAPRPVTPAYSDISLAIQKTFHPPDEVDPERHRGQAARPDGEGRRGEDLLMEAGAQPRRRPARQEGHHRPRQGRAQARLDALRAGGDRDAARDRLSDRATRSTCRCQKFDLRFPDEKEFVGLANYGDVLIVDHLVVGRVRPRCIITVVVGGDRAGARHGDRARDAPGDLRPRPGARRDPDPLRDRHGRRGLRLEVRVRPHAAGSWRACR